VDEALAKKRATNWGSSPSDSRLVGREQANVPQPALVKV